MTQLQEITIKVPSTIAEAYNQANDERKQEIINKKTAIRQLRQTMTEIGQEAQARGLTPEILKEILNEDD